MFWVKANEVLENQTKHTLWFEKKKRKREVAPMPWMIKQVEMLLIAMLHIVSYSYVY